MPAGGAVRVVGSREPDGVEGADAEVEEGPCRRALGEGEARRREVERERERARDCRRSNWVLACRAFATMAATVGLGLCPAAL